MVLLKGGFDPLGLPQGQLAAAGSDGNARLHQCPHPAQLEAAQPLQEEDAADFTVWPPLPLLTNPQMDIKRDTFLLLQFGQSGLSLLKTKYSKSRSHFSQ